jgi:hypothetical protein
MINALMEEKGYSDEDRNILDHERVSSVMVSR